MFPDVSLIIRLGKENEEDLRRNQRTNGPVNAHLISGPSKAQNIKKNNF